ncbi:helix-turn-helix domain-containing protein [Tissierella praeacuta]|uniref:helix-turn-helix domain-containing protein n=1 Tax=Tissierella praeacuta TaxID=43131 RepID=UPI003DA253FF
MLGDNIRNTRKASNKTLNDMAEITGLSIGYISQLERNLIEPSLSSLRKIAKALDVPVYLFMEDNFNDIDVITKKDERLIMRFPNSPVVYEIISPMPTDTFEPSMLGLFFEVEPNKADTEDFITHFSEELIIVLEGEANIILGNEEINIKSGDTLFVKKNIPHKIINKKDTPLRGISIVSPPIYPRQK